ncbi:MAG: c-type cytochrome [Wenzhouxiangella sp.]
MNFLKHATIILLILFVVACLAFWAIALSGRLNIAADEAHWPITDRILGAVRENSVNRQARGVEPRRPELIDELEMFEAIIGYEDMCAVCHTPPGGSSTAMARGLNPPPPDLADAVGERTPAELFWVTKHGIRMTGMPAWGLTHSDDELWPLIALITRFPDFADADYGDLLAAAREAGVEHHHHHHDDEHEHEHEHDHEHDHHDHDQTKYDDEEHDHDHTHHH